MIGGGAGLSQVENDLKRKRSLNSLNQSDVADKGPTKKLILSSNEGIVSKDISKKEDDLKKKSKHKNKDKQRSEQVSNSKHKKEKKEKKEKKSKDKDHKRKDKHKKDEQQVKIAEIFIKKEPQNEKSKQSREKQDSIQKSRSKTQSKDSKKKSLQGKESQKKPRGRKPAPPKKKKMSICEQQNIIAKKFRVKMKSAYCNKILVRKWGPWKDRSNQQKRIKFKDYMKEQQKEKQATTTTGNLEESNIKIQSQIKEDTMKTTIENPKVSVESKQKEQQNNKKQIDQKKQSSKPKSKPRKKKQTTQNQKEKTTEKGIDQKIKQQQNQEQKPKKKRIRSKSVKQVKQQETQQKTAQQASNVKLENEELIQKSKKKAKTKPKSRQTKESTKKSNSKVKKQDYYDSDQSLSDSSNNSEKKSKKKSKIKMQSQKSNRKIREDKAFTKEESNKIIDLFAIDGGNYTEMMKDLPQVTKLRSVRMHLKNIFLKVLDIITAQVIKRCGRKITQWEEQQKTEITRELLRIRSSNRLMSEGNVHFRQKMTQLMRSINDEQHMNNVSANDIENLYTRIEAFVRGYNMLNRSKRSTSLAQSKIKEKELRYKFSKEVTRQCIMQGGKLFQAKREETFENANQPDKQVSFSEPERQNTEWTRQEEKQLCKMYIENTGPDQQLIDQLKQKFGPNPKWKDFELLGRKIDQFIKFALVKLQNLTYEPYCQQERQKQMENRRMSIFKKSKTKQEYNAKVQAYQTKLKMYSMFTYDNDLFQKNQKLEFRHRIFRNLPLMQRQIFGHTQGYKVKSVLIKILIEQFPSQEDVLNAINRLKEYSIFALQKQQKNNITSIKHIFYGGNDSQFSPYDLQKNVVDRQDQIMADLTKIDIIKKKDENKKQQSATLKKMQEIHQIQSEEEIPPMNVEDLPEKIDGLDSNEMKIKMPSEEPIDIDQVQDNEFPELDKVKQLYDLLNRKNCKTNYS